MSRLAKSPVSKLGGHRAAPVNDPTPARSKPRAMLASGPARAMASSSGGAPGSPTISEAPPMGKRTMSLTAKPR